MLVKAAFSLVHCNHHGTLLLSAPGLETKKLNNLPGFVAFGAAGWQRRVHENTSLVASGCPRLVWYTRRPQASHSKERSSTSWVVVAFEKV